jgi:hypothetical protein
MTTAVVIPVVTTASFCPAGIAMIAPMPIRSAMPQGWNGRNAR